MDDLDQNEELSSQVTEDVVAYVNYYGLSGDPFDPEKPLFFATPQLEKSLRLFNYLARFSRKLVVVTGPADAGKTALLENFVTGQEGGDQLCSFAALASDSPTQVLLEIVEQLQVPELTGTESVEQLSQAILDYSLDCLDDDNHCIVVIDDAELFEQPVLELIYQMTTSEPGQRNGVSFLLSGGPQLFENVQKIVPADMMEKAVFHQKMAPFGYEDVAKYLHFHFIENAGQAKAAFSQNEYKMIFEQTQGLPGRINEAAKQVLLAGMGNLLAAEEPAKKNSKGFLFAVAGLVVVIGASFLWWQSRDQQIASDVAEQNLVGKIERADEAAAGQETLNTDQPIFVEPGAAVAEQLSSIEQSTASADDVEAERETADAQTSVEGSVEDSVEDSVEEAVTSGNDAQADDNKMDEILAAKTEQAAKLVADVVAKPQPPMEEIEARAVATHSIAETKTEKTADKPAAESQPESRLARDTARILALKSSDYTMQLLGSKQQQSIKKILAKLPDDNQVMYFEKSHKGAPWYVLIYGNYPDRAAANAAVVNLPDPLKSYKPWVRSVSGIQDTIKANQ